MEEIHDPHDDVPEVAQDPLTGRPIAVYVVGGAFNELRPIPIALVVGEFPAASSPVGRVYFERLKECLDSLGVVILGR